MLEYIGDVGKIESKQCTKDVFIVRWKKNTDVKPFVIALVEAEAKLETTPKTVEKMDSTDTILNNDSGSEETFEGDETVLKEEKAFIVWFTSNASTNLDLDIFFVFENEEEVTNINDQPNT